jgi:CDP-diacylglycerol---serine O-phosphatidyltransferase
MVTDNSIKNFIRLPDVISLCNGVCGMVSIIFSITDNPVYAALFIMLAGFMDYLDGKVARRLSLTSEFGKQLDSLCDLCSFIIAPIVFAYNTVEIQNWQFLVLILYIVAGLLRLARFNITGTLSDGKYFEGMPVPFSIIIIISYFLFLFLDWNLSVWLALYFIHAVLMVSTVKIRKL